LTNGKVISSERNCYISESEPLIGTKILGQNFFENLGIPPEILENGVPVAIGNSPEIQTEVFGRMESGPSVVISAVLGV